MTKRVVEIAKNPAKVTTSRNQIVVRLEAEDADSRDARIPAEDLGLLVLDNPQCSITLPALSKICDSGGAILICDGKHLPAGILHPVSNHCETVHRISDQVNAPKPLVKRLWQQVIKAKIAAQSLNLPVGGTAREKLRHLARGVRSGDAANHEAQAARVYWRALFAAELQFVRDQDGDGINGLLNFGYAVVRAATARALAGSGFCCAIGLHHHNRANPFCLADDLMEPLRPLVDARVRWIINEGEAVVSPETKPALYQLLLDPVLLGDQRLPLMDALHGTSASLAACLRREREALLLPVREDA